MPMFTVTKKKRIFCYVHITRKALQGGDVGWKSWDVCKKFVPVGCRLHHLILVFVYKFLLGLSFKVRAGG